MKPVEFNVIHADNPALEHHLDQLKAAFAGVFEGEDDYQDMVAGIKAGTISLYHLTGDKVDLSLAGEINGDDYFVWAVCGKGLRAGIAELTRRVKSIGLSSISCGTGSPVTARLYRQALGAVMTRKDVHDNGAVTTWHRLEVNHG